MINMTHKQFSEKLKSIDGSLILKSRYTSVYEKVKVQCSRCKYSWLLDPQSLYKKVKCRCKKCRVSATLKSPTTYSRELKIARPDLIQLTPYEHTDINIFVKSKVCGHIIKGGPSNFLHSTLGIKGCYQCTVKVMNTKGNHESFLTELASKKPNVQVLGTYKNRTTKLLVRCDCGYEFMAVPHSLLNQKYGCIECSRLFTGYARKKIKVKGKSFYVQGYEDIFIKKMNKVHPELIDELCSGKDVPTFKYKGHSPQTGKVILRTYRPDFYVPSMNTIVEIKSTYTAAGTKEWFDTLCRKRQAVVDAGYNFSLIVFGKDGVRLQNPKYWYKIKYHQKMFSPD